MTLPYEYADLPVFILWCGLIIAVILMLGGKKCK
jgi:hypothetical protein